MCKDIIAIQLIKVFKKALMQKYYRESFMNDLLKNKKTAETALFSASLPELAKHGTNETLCRLVEDGADVNETDSTGYSALHYALITKDSALAAFLIEKGAYVNGQNEKGVTPLIIAAMNDDVVAVRLLLKHGAWVDHAADDNVSAIDYAIGSCNTQLVELLLAAGVSSTDSSFKVDSKGAAQKKDAKLLGYLYTAIFLKKAPIVEMLINAGCDVNARSEGEETALMLAVEVGSDDMVNILIKKGADVNACDQKGATALIMAAQNERSSRIVNLLLKAGARADIRDLENETALDHAKATGQQQLISLLEKNTVK